MPSVVQFYILMFLNSGIISSNLILLRGKSKGTNKTKHNKQTRKLGMPSFEDLSSLPC